jgi:hypothetical protein
VTQDAIVGQTFENCVLVGPAIILLLGTTTFANNVFDTPSIEAALWDIPADREAVVGVIPLVDCSVMNCRFQRVGLAVPPDQRGAVYASSAYSPDVAASETARSPGTLSTAVTVDATRWTMPSPATALATNSARDAKTRTGVPARWRARNSARVISGSSPW